ncbi:MAG: polymorphic toxin type 44 domain-containing protein [Gallionella sp.]|nr:polymorphic toxin type 44 domain-containing protein [Gallionella sp.]
MRLPWYPRADGALIIYESGVLVGSFGTYTTRDMLAVVYEGNTVRYLKNGITQRSVATTAGRTFYLDTSLYDTGFTLNDLQYGVSNLATASTSITLNGNSLSKTSGTTGWNADAYSQNGLTGGAYISARVGQTNMYGMFGLNSEPTTDSSYTSLDYAWYSLPTGVLQIYESGVLVGSFGTYTPTDVLSVVYEGSTIRYLKNGITQRSVATTAGRTFYLDTSLYNTGYTLNDLQYGVSNLATTSTNITLNGNSISKTSGATGWNADAYSQNGLVSGTVNATTGNPSCQVGSNIAVGASCTVALQFTPTANQAVGIKTATLTLTDNASPATQVISMTGTTVMPANTTATISRSALAFSTPILTNSQVQTLTLSNTGTTPLLVYNTAIQLMGTNPGQFAMVILSPNNCLSVSGVTVPAGGSCALDIQYKPSAGAVVGTTYTANLSFTLNVPVNPSVSLTGTPFTGLNTYYIHSDHLDSPRSITNTAGQEVWRWDNTDPFGNNIANENPANQGNFTFNLRFPGQYFDKETGLHYNVNRDYNPAVGRYIESDPIGLQGGINTFGYVGGNPLGFSDPLGLSPCPCPKVPPHPPSACIDRNIEIAKDYPVYVPYSVFGSVKVAAHFWAFKDNVRNYAPWDYKRQDPKYEAFGNFNYGAVAEAMGMSAYIAENGAGIYQQWHGKAEFGKGTAFIEWPYGDQPSDAENIADGRRYVQCGCKSK